MEKTKGDEFLIQCLEELLAEAKAGEFGDFTNDKYPAPKMALRNKFLRLADDVLKGAFD